jgi:DNA polymerase elongation subunit (family B)
MDFPRDQNVMLSGHDTTIQFQITDFFVPEADKSKKKLPKQEIDYNDEVPEYKILLYGCTLEGHSVCAEVINYHPYFYVRIPDKYATMDAISFKQWINQFKLYLMEGAYFDKKYSYNRQFIPKRFKTHLVSMKLEYKKEFMGFTNNKDFAFLKITVKSLGLFNSLKYLFQNPPKEFLEKYKEPFKLYESNIDPMLRFIHDHDILPCGWIELPAKKYSLIANGCEDDTYCRTNFTVEVDHRFIKPLDWNKTAPLTLVSFDIECTSSHGDFPVASKDYLKLAKDLINLAKYYKDFTSENLIQWIINAYFDTVTINNQYIIHRLYAKNSIQVDKLQKTLENIIDDVIDIMKLVNAENNDSSDDEEEDNPKQINKYEYDIKQLLNNALPKLKGDEIIQIGTTVHRYGSDKIIYKNIITLKSCNPIEGVDVEAYSTESEVLYAWKNLIRRLDPDILMGYNIFGFDMPYIWDRTKELNMLNFGIGLGRLSERECVLNIQRLSSAALGDNVLKYFDMDGVVLVDLYKVMQRTPLDSYKLDFVANLYLGDQKNDLKPYEIFEKFKGDSEDRKIIAEYCIQDCALVNRLFHKLKVLENNNAMGNVCLVPLSYLFMRGQGVKIFSLVAQFCKNKNFAIPVLRNFREDVEEDDSGYEGAIVLHPKEGMYLEDAITVLDYSSLYPSSMIERNLSHDCYVNNEQYDNLPGVDYCTVTYDIYEGIGDKKTKVGEKNCKFVQLPNGEKGLIPQILNKLLTQRKNTRKKIEYETIVCQNDMTYTGLVSEKDEMLVITDIDKNEKYTIHKDSVKSRTETYSTFEQAVFDALQLAYKVTANSLYGQIGSRVSPIYLKEIAACTTATGRERILMAKKFVEEQYGAEVIYGDSVTCYTPVTLRVKNIIQIDKIEDLASKYGNNNWIPCIEEGKQDKESCEIPDYVEVWSDKGWTPIRRVIRHMLADHKKIIRISCSDGSICDVTDDHSLLLKNGIEISPKDVDIGMELLSKTVFIDKSEIVSGCNNEWVNAQVHYLKAGRNCGESSILISKCEIPYEGFVYDLTTANHHFQAGIGQMIVHNTDSIFCKFTHYNEKGEKISGRETLPLGIKAGQRASKEIKSILPPPQCLEYEKTLFPFIIFSKKRYVGLLYEDDANKKPKQKSMGIVLKRRDNAYLVKKIYGGIIDILMNQYDLGKSVEFLKDQLRKLVSGQYPLEDLIITKTLKGSYKDRTKIAHCVLADRMGERDPGNKPQINDRIPYVYIQTNGEVKLQGDRIENPDYVRDNKLTPDYQFYITNQLMKPICQLYALCVERLPSYNYPPSYWIQWDEELKQNKLYENDTKRKNRIDALKEQEAESLLFSEFLEKKRKQRVLASETKKPKSIPIIEHDVKLDAPKLKFSIQENKETKEFTSEIIFLIKHDVQVHKNIVLAKKKLTKTDACNKIMYDIITEIVKSYGQVIQTEGILLEFDKYYTRVLKQAIEKQESILEELEKAQKEGDFVKFEEYTNLLTSFKIAQVLHEYKHKFI